MKKNFLLMSINLCSKLLINVFIFVILARYLTLNDYGKLMYFYTLSNIVNVFVDYGFNLYTVKEMAANKKSWQKIFNKSLESKIVLTAIITLIFIPQVLFTKEDNLIFILFFITGVLTSFINYFMLPYRILNNYKFEMNISLLSNVTLFLIVIAFACISENLIYTSIGFSLSRIAVIFIELYLIRKDIKISLNINFKDSLLLLKKNFPYGLHLVIGTIYFQIDTLVLNYFSDYNDVGQYQSAFRIIMAALIFTEIFSNIILPKLATLKTREVIVSYTKKVNYLLTGFGIIIGALLYFSSDLIINIMYGNNYGDSSLLLRILSFMLLFRYMSTIDGVLLTVLDKQKVRTVLAFIALLINITFSILFVKQYYVTGAAIASVLTSFILMLIYKITTIVLLKKDGKVFENENKSSRCLR